MLLFFRCALLSVSRVMIIYLAFLVSTLLPLGHNNIIIITYAQEEIEGVNASIGGEGEDELPSIKILI